MATQLSHTHTEVWLGEIVTGTTFITTKGQLTHKQWRSGLGKERSQVQYPGPAGEMWEGLVKEKVLCPPSTYIAEGPRAGHLMPNGSMRTADWLTAH